MSCSGRSASNAPCRWCVRMPNSQLRSFPSDRPRSSTSSRDRKPDGGGSLETILRILFGRPIRARHNPSFCTPTSIREIEIVTSHQVLVIPKHRCVIQQVTNRDLACKLRKIREDIGEAVFVAQL